jgi:hypothetical protein
MAFVTFSGAGFGKSAPRKVPNLSKGLPEITRLNALRG